MDFDLTWLRRQLELYASSDDDIGGRAMLEVVAVLRKHPRILTERLDLLAETANHPEAAARWWTLLTFQNLGYNGPIGPAHLRAALLLASDPSDGIRYEAAMSVANAVRTVPGATRLICETLANLEQDNQRGLDALACSLTEMNEDALADVANVVHTGAGRARRMATRQILRILAFDNVSNKVRDDLLNDPVVGAALRAASS